MRSFICLLLDEHCQVMLALIEHGRVEDVTKKIQALNKERAAWGYEIWADGVRVEESYDCQMPPSRVHLHR
jgi:hypothetical protein